MSEMSFRAWRRTIHSSITVTADFYVRIDIGMLKVSLVGFAEFLPEAQPPQSVGKLESHQQTGIQAKRGQGAVLYGVVTTAID